MTRLAATLTLALVLACKGGGPEPAPAPGQPAPGAAPVETAGFVTAATVLRREPTDAPRIPGPTGKEVSSYVATLQRGERVTVLESGTGWLRVRASDDKEGWLKAAAVLQGEGIVEATVRDETDVFDRPDLLAANAKRKVAPGTLLLVVKVKAPFSEVNVTGTGNAWVLSERLATGERDVSVAKLIEKARWLTRSNKPDEARAILSLAQEHFAGEPLVDVLVQELNPPEGGLVVPASGAVDAGEAPR